MSGFFFTSAGGSPTNVDSTYESFGRTVALGTACPAHATAHTKGVWTQLNSTGTGNGLVNDITDLEFFFQIGSSSSTRYLVDIGVGDGTTGAGTTVVIDNMWVCPATIGGKGLLFPLNIAAGSKVWARCSASAGSTPTLTIYGRGQIRTADTLPRYNNCAQIYPSGSENIATTYPNTTNITAVTAAGGALTEWVASTPGDAAAFAFNIGVRSTGVAPTPGQNALLRVAKTGGDTVFYEHSWTVINGATVFHSPMLTPAFHVVPSGTRLSVEILAADAATVVAPQIWRLW